jgi:AcrR family transcriptional regulator
MRQNTHTKRQILHDMLADVPRRQAAAAVALVGGARARTYREAAARMGVHVGTLYTHLRRLRLRYPEVYAALMDVRGDRLAARHKAALARDWARSRAWHKRQANRRYRARFGCWPWEARRRRP